ncbi:MAG: hypothetical protein M3291_13810 [Actinomycetota bacterium]|nr:hypothetical protein [Actinomycetota bacterium]
MTLLAVERIKLFSTRSPWWCLALVIAFGVGFAALAAAFANEQFPLSPQSTQGGATFGQYVIMVMAAIAVTTEYRFGTIRATFAAVPSRIAVLLSKTTVLALLAGMVGLISAFASWGVATLIAPGTDIALDTAQEWRGVAGVALVFAASAVLAVAVGILLRQTAAAVALLLVWALVVENVLAFLPRIGDDIGPWLPFFNAGNFLAAGDDVASGAAFGFTVGYPFGPWGSLGYFAAISLTLLVISFVVAQRRDA